MKALVTAFALLSFVAASTVPYVASAATQTEKPMTHKKKASAKKKVHAKKTSTKKRMTKKTANQPA